MTGIERLERDLAAWLAETAAPRVPDYANDIVRRTANVRQRRRWTFLARWLPGSVTALPKVSPRPLPWRTLGLIAILVLLILATLALIAGSHRRVPPFGPAANGLVAYARTGDIYTVDPATGSRRAIVTGPTNDHDPRFSRDGARIAFLRETRPGLALVIVDADGRNPLVATNEPFAFVDTDSIVWSPDGRWIAVAATPRGQAAGTQGSLYLVDTALGGVRQLAVDYAHIEPYWRPPDGRQLLFQGRRGSTFALLLVTPDSGQIEEVPVRASEHGLRPLGWTPDGRRLLYRVDDESAASVTRVLDLDTGEEIVLDIGFGRVSNDGRRVVGDLADAQLCVMPIDGGACALLGDRSHVTEGTGSQFLSWSPDDEWIIVRPRTSLLPALLDPDTGEEVNAPWLALGGQSWQRR